MLTSDIGASWKDHWHMVVLGKKCLCGNILIAVIVTMSEESVTNWLTKYSWSCSADKAWGCNHVWKGFQNLITRPSAHRPLRHPLPLFFSPFLPPFCLLLSSSPFLLPFPFSSFSCVKQFLCALYTFVCLHFFLLIYSKTGAWLSLKVDSSWVIYQLCRLHFLNLVSYSVYKDILRAVSG